MLLHSACQAAAEAARRAQELCGITPTKGGKGKGNRAAKRALALQAKAAAAAAVAALPTPTLSAADLASPYQRQAS